MMALYVDPDLYDDKYYLSNNVGYEEFIKGLDTAEVNYKFIDVLKYSHFTTDTTILDIGCGRGEMVYYAAKAGCKKAVGIDYSASAIKLANSFKARLNDDMKTRMFFFHMDALSYPENEKFDYIYMIEVWEHMYDEQLCPLLKKIHTLLKRDGFFILTTPNGFYERYLYPAKRIINIPGNLFKYPVRILRKKWKPKSIGDFFRHIFKIKPFPDPFCKRTHVNVSTPPKIRRMLKEAGFRCEIKCWDYSKNPLSILFSRWAGREMMVIARKYNP